MANSNGNADSSKNIQREVLPIPDRPYAGFVAYDAKDPDSKFPPIEPLRPPKGAPNVLIVLIDDVGFGASSAFGGPCQAPTAERIAKDGLALHAISHHGPVLADACGALERTKSPYRRNGRHHGDRDLGSRLHVDATQLDGAAAGDSSAQRLFDRAVRQVPRGPGLGSQPRRPVRSLADGLRLRILLRFRRWRDQSMVSVDSRGHESRRAAEDARRGLSFHGGHDGSRDCVGAPAATAGRR